jgi:hypothetical protein
MSGDVRIVVLLDNTTPTEMDIDGSFKEPPTEQDQTNEE